MCDRIPNLDLKFFATAVILQRQTGGDLAEILDKIGQLVRERFQIMGQVQALTGEGRLSGVVLLALPRCCSPPSTTSITTTSVCCSPIDGQEDAALCRDHASPGGVGDPKNRRDQGVTMFAVILHRVIRVHRLLPLAIFGLFAALAWLPWNTCRNKAAGRGAARRDQEPAETPLGPGRSRPEKARRRREVLEKASALAKPLAPKSEADANKLKYKLASAGFRGEGLVPIFWA